MQSRKELANAIRVLSMDAVQKEIGAPRCSDGDG
jgi:transketolase